MNAYEPRALQTLEQIEEDRRRAEYQRLLRVIAKALAETERRADGWAS